MCEGVSAEQAQGYLQHWLDFWQQAQQQPMVLPAALLLKALEDGKQYQWIEQNQHTVLEPKSQDAVLKVWNATGDFSSFDKTQDEASKLHRDWQFVLQEQDASALLQAACDTYSFKLYQPMYQFLTVE